MFQFRSYFGLIVAFFFLMVAGLNLHAQNIYNIPTTIHIIHAPSDPQGSPTHPTDAQVQELLDWTNEVLRGQMTCGINEAGVNSNIQLCEARQDIQENSSEAIYRIESPLHKMDMCEDELALKQLPRQSEDLYPNTDYLNIYIVGEICNSCDPLGCQVGGFAAYPPSHGTDLDGIVLEAITVTSEDCNLRKTFIHELGHYLGLYHTFRNSCQNKDCETDGDGICDTPPDDYTNFYPSNPCLKGGNINSCGTDVNASDPNNPFSSDQQDMTDNFMDYSPTACIQRFTEGQTAKMRETLETTRGSLLESKGCEESCTPPIQFSLSIPDTIIAGRPARITNNTTNAASYKWIVDGQEYTTQYLEHQWDTTGTFIIYVTAENSTGCINDTSFMVIVDCGIYPGIIFDSTSLALGDTIIATSKTNNQINLSYSWTLNGQNVSAGEQLQYIPSDGGNYAIGLEVCNSYCCELATTEHVGIGQCPTGKEGNHWIFGYDGIHLDFSTGVPVEQPSKPISSHEVMGIATTPQGELLFYSNGEVMFDRMDSKEIMEYDSSGLPPYSPIKLAASSPRPPHSATQSVVLPQPGNDSLWYFFYSDAFHGSDLKLDTTLNFYYAIVNVNKRGGKGKLVSYDIPLLTPATERVAATRHCNGEDWWIISEKAGGNSKFAWLLTKDGLTSPVVSDIGRSNGWISNSKVGQMKISADGSKFCKATRSNKNGPPSLGFVECFQFDNSWGKLSNNIIIADSLRAYGIEFAPNGERVFITGYKPSGLSSPRGVMYKNFSKVWDDTQNNPLIKISHDTLLSFGGLQLAPNGSIYVANGAFSGQKTYISEIRYPDSPDKVEYIHKSVTFNNGEGWNGLPYFPADIYTPGNPWLEGPTLLCDTIEEALFFVKGNCRYQEYHWEIDGPSTIQRNEGDSIWIQPVHSDSLQELRIMKFTACQTKYDTISFMVDSCKIDTMPEEECSLAFEWTSLDTLLCRGEESQLRFATNASSAELVNMNSGQRQNVSLGGLKISGLIGDTDYELHLNGLECDSVLPFTIHINAPLSLSGLRLDSIVCAGDSAEINMTTDADLIDVFDDEQTVGWRNPSFPLYVPVMDSTRYFIRLRHTDRGCDTLFSFNVKEEEDNTREDTAMICNSDTLNWRGQELSSAGDYEDIVPQAQGCDSVYRMHVDILSSDTTLIENLDCSVSSVQKDTVFYQNVQGCDSLVITTTLPLQADTTYLSTQSCDPTQTGMDTAYYQNTAGCDSIVITSTILLPSDTTYQSGITCDIQDSGTDTVFYTNQYGCDSILIIDKEYRDINVELVPDQIVPQGDTLLLIAQTNANTDSIYWRPPYSSVLQRPITAEADQSFMIFIRDSSGCLISDTINIFVEAETEAEIYIPNIFTPNGDGINDVFRPMSHSSAIRFQSMQIFDRWGTLVHESRGDLEWDGRFKGELRPDGVYVYIVRYSDGTEDKYVSGTVSLVR